MKSQIILIYMLFCLRIMVITIFFYNVGFLNNIYSFLIAGIWLGIPSENLTVIFIIAVLRILTIIGFFSLLRNGVNLYIKKITNFLLIFEITGLLTALFFIYAAKGFSEKFQL